MAINKYLGDFSISTNYEVKRNAPFDARMLRGTKASLTDPTQWSSPITMYAGMLVAVVADETPENNGLYILKQLPFTNENNWYKFAEEGEYGSIQEQINQIQADLSNYVSKEDAENFAKLVIVGEGEEFPTPYEGNTFYLRPLDGNLEEYILYNGSLVQIGLSQGGVIDAYTKAQADAKFATKEEIPDVSNFITNTVDNLVNYYLKSDTYSKTEVDGLLSQIQGSRFEVVAELPQTGEANVIYLLSSSSPSSQDIYDEYIYVNGTWEKIGNTAVDLSNYVTTETFNSTIANYALKTELPTALSQLTNDEGFVTIQEVQSELENYVSENELETQLAGKQDTLVSGTNIKTINGQSLLGSGNITIQGGGGGTIAPATEDTVGGILSTDNSMDDGKEVYVDVDEVGKASVKIPSIAETSTAQDVVDLLNTDNSLILNGNA